MRLTEGWSARQLLHPVGLGLLLCTPWGWSKGGCLIFRASGWELTLDRLTGAIQGLGVATWAQDGAGEALYGQLTLGCWALLLASLAVLTCVGRRKAGWHLAASALAAGSLASLLALAVFESGKLEPLTATAVAALPISLVGLSAALAWGSRWEKAAALLRGTGRTLLLLGLLLPLTREGLALWGGSLTAILCGWALLRVESRLQDVARTGRTARFVLPPAEAAPAPSAPAEPTRS